MFRTLIRYAALAGVVGLGACDLVVTNPNNPETDRVLARPADTEALLGSYYLRWHSGLYGSLSTNYGMSMVQSLENYSSLSNNCQGQRVGIPRAANDNSIGNGCNGDQQRVYFFMSEVGRVASNILEKLDEKDADGNPVLTLGSRAQDLRAKAFGELLRGLSLGYLALVYDQAAIISPNMSTAAADCVPDGSTGICTGALRPYTEVMDSAFAALQRALDSANATATLTGNDAPNGFPLPATWIPSGTSFTLLEFKRLVRSYRARFRANLPRDPAERANVDWAAVILDVDSGFTADHLNTTNSVTGPFNSWVSQLHTFTTWHQMSPFIAGMADGADGAYAAWIAQPIDQRGSSGGFFMVSPDLRWPQGATRDAQQADFAINSCRGANQTCKRYFVNRPSGSDNFSGFGWGWSNYDFTRFISWRTSGVAGTARNGPLVFFTKAELNLLKAEAYLRLPVPNYDSTRVYTNISRVAIGGLPAITASDNTTPVPGGAACVPKVPVAPFNVVACGNLEEAMKYEKRMETIQTHFAAWFFDSRRWGDLPIGTGLDWAVPYADLQARGFTAAQIYSTGGGNNIHSAPVGSYGY